MNLPLAGLIVLLLIVVWLLLRRRQSAPGDDPKPAMKSSANATYHAVSIKFESSACKAARDMEGRRFLSTAAPKLPLPECDVLECNCRFVHHKDRRAGKDRRSPFAPAGFGGTSGDYEEEQRAGKDRRHSDNDELF